MPKNNDVKKQRLKDLRFKIKELEAEYNATISHNALGYANSVCFESFSLGNSSFSIFSQQENTDDSVMKTIETRSQIRAEMQKLKSEYKELKSSASNNNKLKCF